MRISALLLRRLHKWTGLLLGLQLVIWTISGAVMATLDMEAVAGGPRPPPLVPAALTQDAPGWAEARRLLGPTPVTGVALRPLLDRYVIEVQSRHGTRLFDAGTGRPVRVDAPLAARIAAASYVGGGRIRSIAPLADVTLPVREHELPIWQVDFSDTQNSSYYVSAATGQLLERRNDTWRTWDFFWMLHSMDYAARTSFNHPLIIAVGFGILWLAITGLWLLCRTAWKPDLRAAARAARKLRGARNGG